VSVRIIAPVVFKLVSINRSDLLKVIDCAPGYAYDLVRSRIDALIDAESSTSSKVPAMAISPANLPLGGNATSGGGTTVVTPPPDILIPRAGTARMAAGGRPMKRLEFKVPDSVVARCGRLQCWDDAKGQRVLVAYRQFIELKVLREDWWDDSLAPSAAVEFMWHQHILDARQYYQACIDFSGNII
jgi:hypothetical protein